MTGSQAEGHDINYVKIWAILVALLAISVIGPLFEIRVVTLLTAFGIAVVKAYLVAKNFMHVNLAPRFIPYAIITSLLFMFLFYAGVAPDVNRAQGQGWEKPAWIAAGGAAPVAEAAGHEAH
jgi:caa(3)-type oxidase subunit IV